RLITNYQQKHDPLGIQRPSVTFRQQRQLDRLILRYAAGGIAPEDMRYRVYMDSRMPWWAGALHANVFGLVRICPLLSWQAARLVYEVEVTQRQIDRLHFEVLRRVHPRLVELPLAAYTWDERLLPEFRRHGLQPSEERL